MPHELDFSLYLDCKGGGKPLPSYYWVNSVLIWPHVVLSTPLAPPPAQDT